MTDVTLSSAVRSNLLSLQNTADMMSKTQERLATGLKVNSALDNPTNFFTASSLNSRANDLSRLLDSVSNATQTLEAADNGITAITNLVESAQATARQAQQTPATVDQTNVTAEAAQSGTATIAADTAAALTGSVAFGTPSADAGDTLTSLSDGDQLTITLTAADGTTNDVQLQFNTASGGPSLASGFTEVDIAGSETVDDVRSAIQTAVAGQLSGSTVAFDSSDNLVITAGDNTTSISVSGTASDDLFGTTTSADPTNAAIGALSGTVTVGSNTLTFGSGNIETRADLEDALGNLTGGITGSIDSSNNIQLEGSDGASFTVGGDAANLTALGLTAGTEEATTNVTQVTNTARGEFVSQYNELMGQINELAEDAGFNGVNLLNGDDLSVIFNEDGSSTLEISGETFDAAGLGLSELTATGLDTDASIDAVLTSLDGAISSLRSQSSEFGSNLSIVETREDFTKSMINTLETGAANLTLADTNEEGANLLALQTRQQLSSTALSLASQADQNVLRLF